jgi:hypothetical protein
MLEGEQFWELAFWVGVWGLAGFSGTVRAAHDGRYSDLGSLVSVGLFSGMVGFGTVAFWVGGLGGHVGHELRYLGLATLIGLAGKEQERLVSYVVCTTFDKLGVHAVHKPQDEDGDSGTMGDDDDSGGSNRVE